MSTKVTAARIYEYGEPDVFRFETMDVPDPVGHEVLVRNTVIGLNFVDIYYRRGTLPVPEFPGVLLAGAIPASYLFFILGVILLLSPYQTLAKRRDPALAPTQPLTGRSTTRRLDSSYPDRALGRDIAYRVERLPMGMMLMYGAGLISALLGIGSGVLKVPAMDTALRLPIKVSSATSNFMICVTAAASAGAYFVRGDIVAPIAGPVALGSVIGAILGARFLMSIPSERIRLLFAVVLVALAAQMFHSALGPDLIRGAR